MTRKGNKKVRTGCLTCKARKVKCDEAKPWCNRCSSTGRTCEGYSYNPDYNDSDPEHAITQQLPLRISSSPMGASSESENRSLQYYYEVAAPYLAGNTGSYFWTQLVMQFSESHLAVRHSVIAISSLYRQIQESPVPQGNAAIWDSHLTLHHYNAAIRELKATPTPTEHQQPLVLLVCVLFICIEFMQSNREAAIQHCKHGMLILENCKPEYSWASDHLLPVFRRMSAFPFFFGHGPSDYPDLSVLTRTNWEPFGTIADARDMMDEIFSRTLSLMRWGDEYRMGAMQGQPVPKHLLDENINIESMLEIWKRFYDTLDLSLNLSPSTDTTHSTLSLGDPQSLVESYILLIRYEACQIMLSKSLNFNEMHYDEHHPGWLRICDMLHSLASIRRDQIASGVPQPRFVFDMGAMPILTFVLLKCRYFDIRRSVWNLISYVGSSQESLWERSFIRAMSRRVIELEHGTTFDESGEPNHTALWEVTPEDQRMQHVWGDPKPTLRVIYGKEIRGRAVGFFYKGKDHGYRMTTEFLEEPADPVEE